MEMSIVTRIDPRIQAVVEEHRRIRHRITTLHCGHSFVVNPGVFSPFIAPSGRIGLAFASQPDCKGKRVLDVGCGSGVIAALMALSGAAHVVGVDINPAAVENARKNASNLNLTDRTDFRVGRLFEPVDPAEEFDVILADLPFTDGEPNDALEAAFFDPGLVSIRDLVSGLPARLKRPESKAYICLSNLDGEQILPIFDRLALKSRVSIEMNLEWISLRLLQITT